MSGVPAVVHVSASDSTSDFDAVVAIAHAGNNKFAEYAWAADLAAARAADDGFENGISVVVSKSAPGSRIVYTSVGSTGSDCDTVEKYAEAAQKAVERARAAGSVAPLVVVAPGASSVLADYSHALEVSLLGALAACYELLQKREWKPNCENVKRVGFVRNSLDSAAADRVAKIVHAISSGRRLCRDIGYADPERMAPPRCAEYLINAFKDLPSVAVTVFDDQAELTKSFPCMMAVSRASQPRHHARLVRLVYKPADASKIQNSLFFAGKGVTYDTGGADVKTSGHMAGMSADKVGAAAIAGFVLTAALLGAPTTSIVAELGFVRNSIGSNCYVSDEIITSKGGVRIKVGNTDAEGRMVLTDCLASLREQILSSNPVKPHLFSVATLTGHVLRAYGGVPAVVSNGPAVRADTPALLQRVGTAWADPFEISTLRQCDYDFIKAAEDTHEVLQCNNEPSSATARGHHFPAAFLARVSGLTAHGIDSSNPLPYSHLDIAGAAWNHPSYASPITALTAAYLL